MSAAVPARPLAELTALSAERLYVFVVGPGVGEGLAVALPGNGWVMFDGCKTRGRYPLREIQARFSRPGEALECFVWTHPHLDHAEGVAQLVAEAHPRRVAITGLSARDNLLTEYERLRAASRSVTSDAQKARRVANAIQAISDRAADDPDLLLTLIDGVRLPLSTTSVSMTARAPDAAGLGSWFAAQSSTKDFFQHVNEISAVIELEFGQTRVVLGGDLPRFRDKRQLPVPTGWDSVLVRRPELGDHRGLKLPHHGSPEAYHPDLHTQASGRSWWVTPFNASGLPAIADLDGLPKLLAREPAVELTALPASKKLQVPLTVAGGRVNLAQLVPRTPGSRVGGIRIQDDALYIKSEGEPEPLEPVWCAEFDAQGNVTARYRGAVALEVTT